MAPGNDSIVKEIQFRKALPVFQTAIAIFFGGWGLWVRNAVLNRPFGDSSGWASTLRFHVWPWPFKFTAILNMPAFLAGLTLSWLLDKLRPGFPEWVSSLPVLIFIPLLWYWVGSWSDKRISSEQNIGGKRAPWILLLLFLLVCAAAASISNVFGGHTDFVESGILIWMIALVCVKTYAALRKRNPKVA
jgi:hypothetical protein